MKHSALLACLIVTSLAGLSAPAAEDAKTLPFESESQELLYYWGASFGQQVAAAGVDSADDVAWIARGLEDQAAGKSPEFGEEYRSLLNNFLVKRRNAMIAAERERSAAYLDELARQKGAIRLDSGVVYRELAAGSGEPPTVSSKIRIHYEGRLRDGEGFDSSRERGEAFETRLTAVIGCWKDAVPLMQPGGRAIIGCPPDRAYGDRGTPDIPPGAALEFEVELLDVLD